MQLTRTVDATTEPVTLAQAKNWIKQDSTVDDTQTSALITAARQWCEDYCGIAMLEQTWKLTLDEFPQYSEVINLPRPPKLSGGTFTVQYLSEAGATETVSTSVYRVVSSDSQIQFGLSQYTSWPASVNHSHGVIDITYQCGFGSSADDVPQQLKQAVLMSLAHQDVFRQPVVTGSHGEVPLTLRALLDPWRVQP